MSAGTRTALADVVLPALPGSTGAARSQVRAALDDARLDHVVDSAELLVSELVTNVVLHVGGDLQVRVDRRSDRVRVTVLDTGARPPARRRYGLGAGTGRGLALVETLADCWGWEPADAPWSKAVWFELLEDGSSGGDAEGALYGEDWLGVIADL